MIECDKHELSFIARCCPHVAASVDSGETLVVHAVADEWNDVHHLCSDCAQRVRPWLEAYRRGEGGLAPLELSDGAQCVECVREWYRLTGLGELSPTVARAREERLMLESERKAATGSASR
jgi:hypothetical protein